MTLGGALVIAALLIPRILGSGELIPPEATVLQAELFQCPPASTGPVIYKIHFDTDGDPQDAEVLAFGVVVEGQASPPFAVLYFAKGKLAPTRVVVLVKGTPQEMTLEELKRRFPTPCEIVAGREA